MTFVGGGAHAVIGCTLPVRPLSASLTISAQTSSESLKRATNVRDAHAAELMAYPAVQAIGPGASYDSPGEPAIVFFVTQGQSRSGIPLQVDGVRTRIVEGALFAGRGAVSAEETKAMEQSLAQPQLVYAVSDAEMARAGMVHAAHVDEWMNKPGVQGVGITSSVDSPGEAALLIYLIRGAEHAAIPPVVDGLRTRVREGSRFVAGLGPAEAGGSCKVPKTIREARSAKTKTK